MKTFHITELGKNFGLSRSTLLYYDRIGLLHPSSRTHADYRQYTQDDLIRLERICFFREAGLSLDEIAQLLQSPNNNGVILEGRLREIGREVAALKSQQRLIAGMLKTVATSPKASGLDKNLWLGLQKACGLNEAALKNWHIEFERRAPGVHHEFLLGLGLSEKEALQIRMLTKNIEDNTMSMRYFYELFEDLPRQGPGCKEATLKALSYIKDIPTKPRVLDIGCGCGKQTQILAQKLRTKVLAIDNHRPVLDHLDQMAQQSKLQIETRELSMIHMPFEDESFDILWAEGSIFIIGLERGLKDFRVFLKPKGYLAFSELCWFENDHPPEAQEYFNRVYADIRSVDEVRQMAKENGYKVIGSFQLPESAWWDEYFTPMLARMKELKSKNAGVAEAEAIYAECTLETEMFRRYSQSYGYAFFVLQKNEESICL